jgi:hypothetical protein
MTDNHALAREASTLGPPPEIAYAEMQVEAGYLGSKEPAKFLLSVFGQYRAELMLRTDLSQADRRQREIAFVEYVQEHLNETVNRINEIHEEMGLA